VILHHHGIFIWRENWKKVKLMAEACHHLLEMTAKMGKLSIDEYNQLNFEFMAKHVSVRIA
jgi:hypothetical protein